MNKDPIVTPVDKIILKNRKKRSKKLMIIQNNGDNYVTELFQYNY